MRLGRRAGTIFRSTLTLLQSTASLMKAPTQDNKLFATHPAYRQALYPVVTPSFGRSTVQTGQDIVRPQPVAEVHVEPVEQKSPNTPNSVKQDSDHSPRDSHDEEEDRAFNKFFLLQDVTQQVTHREGRPMSNGIDCGRQGVTLWQFILELLADPECNNIVSWTDVHLEFKVMNSKEMARRWGARKNRPKMNYDKLSRALRYYYRKNLIQHVPGKRQVYFFVEHPESLDFTQMLNTALRTHPLRSRRVTSAFSHVSSTVPVVQQGVKQEYGTAGIKRLNTPPTLEMDIKKAKEMDLSPPSMISNYSPSLPSNIALLTPTSGVSLLTPTINNMSVLTPTTPNRRYQDSLQSEVEAVRQMEYHRLAVAALVSSGFKMPNTNNLMQPTPGPFPSPTSLSPQSPTVSQRLPIQLVPLTQPQAKTVTTVIQKGQQPLRPLSNGSC